MINDSDAITKKVKEDLNKKSLNTKEKDKKRFQKIRAAIKKTKRKNSGK